MGGRQYQRAKAELNARGDIQACWSCGKTLYTEVTYPHPNSITLGHYTAREDGGALYDPNNYGPQCMTCNYGDGARRTNNKLGNPHRSQQQRLSTTNDNW